MVLVEMNEASGWIGGMGMGGCTMGRGFLGGKFS